MAINQCQYPINREDGTLDNILLFVYITRCLAMPSLLTAIFETPRASHVSRMRSLFVV